MKIANNLPQLIFLLLILLHFSCPVRAVDNFKEFKRDQWDLELRSSLFYSDANYSSGGGSQSLQSGSYYQLLNINFESRYVPRRDWSVFGWGTVGNAESRNSLATRSNSSLSEGAIGLDFLMYSDKLQLVPEIIAVIPFEKVDNASDVVTNSEGVFEVRSRLIGQRDFGSWRGYGWLGFNYRGEGRSFLMPWGIGTQFKHTGWRWGLELFGYQSVSEDTDKSSPLRTAFINTANAGSFKFYSINPNLMDSQVYGSWFVSPKILLQLQGGTTLNGSNSAAGYHVGGFVRYSFDMTEGYRKEAPEARSADVYEESDVSSERKVRRFRESLDDGVDQSLFKRTPPAAQDKDLQIQLDETEFNVELKSKKRKER